MLDAMTLAIDRAGRIVVPKTIRDRLGLRPGTELELSTSGDTLHLRPARQQPALLQIRGVWVHQGVAEGDLTKAVEEARNARIRELSNWR